MYIIEENKPYIVDGKKAYSISFGDNGKLVVNKEEAIDVSNNAKKFSYDEIIRKFNVKFMVEKRKQELEKANNESEKIKALKEQLDSITKENQKLKKEISLFKKNDKGN